jgi:DNA-binding winged helix-turn-helix (wHTH) protein
MPPTLENAMESLLVDVDGLPVLVRFLIKDIPPELRSGFVSKAADIHSLLSRTPDKTVDRMRPSSQRRDAPSNQPAAIVELTSTPVRVPVLPNETVLQVGPLELDLLERTAKRGDRRIDLLQREFQLLKYMMQRRDEILTRETLLKEVWHYKVVPETNVVDVQMGRLRRKVDGPNEALMIRSVRSLGFVLSATPTSLAPVAPSSASYRAPSAIADDSRENRNGAEKTRSHHADREKCDDQSQVHREPGRQSRPTRGPGPGQ